MISFFLTIFLLTPLCWVTGPSLSYPLPVACNTWLFFLVVELCLPVFFGVVMEVTRAFLSSCCRPPSRRAFRAFASLVARCLLLMQWASPHFAGRLSSLHVCLFRHPLSADFGLRALAAESIPPGPLALYRDDLHVPFCSVILSSPTKPAFLASSFFLFRWPQMFLFISETGSLSASLLESCLFFVCYDSSPTRTSGDSFPPFSRDFVVMVILHACHDPHVPVCTLFASSWYVLPHLQWSIRV